MNVSKQFNSFAGREVNVTEKVVRLTVKEHGVDYTGVEADYSATDPVIVELQDAAEKAGLSLRVWLPDSMGTMDMRPNRLNVHIAKESDGKYRIQPGMNLG